MRVVVITPPTPVVTWGEAKDHLRLDGDDEQSIVNIMIAAATGKIDGPMGWLNRSIGKQTLEVRFDLPAAGRSMRLPFGPVIDLESVNYVDRSGVDQSAALADFKFVGDDIVPANGVFPWDANGSIDREAGRIRYTAGFDPVPEAIKMAILLMVGDLHRFRSTASDMNITPTAIPMSATPATLLQPYRFYR